MFILNVAIATTLWYIGKLYCKIFAFFTEINFSKHNKVIIHIAAMQIAITLDPIILYVLASYVAIWLTYVST